MALTPEKLLLSLPLVLHRITPLWFVTRVQTSHRKSFGAVEKKQIPPPFILPERSELRSTERSEKLVRLTAES
ncbi:hypothetical protein DPEC_G00254250, partial [Dallia pectoralis]